MSAWPSRPLRLNTRRERQAIDARQPPSPSPEHDPEFDEFAGDYDKALAEGISVSGEDKTFFAQGRVEFLAGCLAKLGAKPASILDYGCGTGTSTPYLLSLPGASSLVGLDVSAKSLEVATETHGSDQASFGEIEHYQPKADVDLVHCNGVFHHIPLDQRAAAIEFVRDALKPGGLFAFWENNPWNPGTRYVMSKIPFDRDAVTLSASESARLVKAGGLEVVRVDFMFIFPAFLGFMRWVEPLVSRLPMGAQYQVLCRKPNSGA